MHLQNTGTYSPNAFLSLISFRLLSLTKMLQNVHGHNNSEKFEQEPAIIGFSCLIPSIGNRTSSPSESCKDSPNSIKSPPCTSDTGNRKVAVPCFPPLHRGAQQVTGMGDIGRKKHRGNPHRDVTEMEPHLFPSKSIKKLSIY